MDTVPGEKWENVPGESTRAERTRRGEAEERERGENAGARVTESIVEAY